MSTIRKSEALGWGPVTTVFRGWDELLDQPIAIKELLPGIMDRTSFVRAYFQQAMRLADLAHPHLLAVFKVEANGRPPALYRELAAETLAHQLLEGPLGIESIPRLLRHALAGLAALHQRDLIHRAIKPENLFVCGEVFKVGDFGLPLQDGLLLTPARHRRFLAPESHGGTETAATDLYSLGLTLYELSLGTAKFEKLVENLCRESGTTFEEQEDADPLLEQVWRLFPSSNAEMPPLHEIEAGFPIPLSLVLHKLVSRDPLDRYQSCREVETALGSAGLLDSKTLAIAPPNRQVLVTRPSTVWAASVVIALGLGGTALWRASQAAPPPDGTKAPAAVSASALSLAALEHSRGLTLEFDSMRRPVRIQVGTPMRFQVRSERAVYFALFAEFSDGSVACLYPGPTQEPVRLRAGETISLPRLGDEAQGFAVVASPPLGRDRIYLLTSESPLLPTPPGQDQGWVSIYPKDAAAALTGSADDFRSWVASVRTGEPNSTRLAVLEVEVIGTETQP